jgi:hypothetical protein
MAKVANAFTTYSAVANREDLSNNIYNIDPFDTPIFNSAGRRNVSNRTFDWQTEKLPAIDGDNARQEGFELNRSPAQATGHQMALKSKALKRDMETILASAQPLNYGDDSGTPVPRRTRGLIHWLRTNAFVPTSGGTPVVTLPATETAAYPTVAGGARIEFTEAVLGAMMQTAFNNGAEPKLLISGPSLKRTLSTFKGRDTTSVVVGKTEVVMTVDIYVSDFGRLKALPTRFMDANTVLLLDPAYLKVAYYRTLRQIPIAKIGDAETRMILGEWGVEVGNEAAHAVLVGANPAASIAAANIGTQ